MEPSIQKLLCCYSAVDFLICFKLSWMPHRNVLPCGCPQFCCCFCSEGAKRLNLCGHPGTVNYPGHGGKSFVSGHKGCSHTLQVHFVPFCKQFATLAASCTGGVIMFGPRLMREMLTTINLLQRALIITLFYFF